MTCMISIIYSKRINGTVNNTEGFIKKLLHQQKLGKDSALLEHVYMIREVNSNRFEIPNRFEMSFGLHGNFHGDFLWQRCCAIGCFLNSSSKAHAH